VRGQACRRSHIHAFAAVMFQSPRTYLRRLLVNYGEHFCLLLCSVYGGLKGPVFQMITSAQLPYFKSIGITGQQYQSYGTVASTPWAMKAAIGITSDAVPLWGWHKRPYMLIGSGSCHLPVTCPSCRDTCMGTAESVIRHCG
jgi:hypothetical protein